MGVLNLTPDSFYSGAASNDEWTYSFTFEIDGDYNYECNPHAGMAAIISDQVSQGPPGRGDYSSVVDASNNTSIRIFYVFRIKITP